jgi:hypothetical protein
MEKTNLKNLSTFGTFPKFKEVIGLKLWQSKHLIQTFFVSNLVLLTVLEWLHVVKRISNFGVLEIKEIFVGHQLFLTIMQGTQSSLLLILNMGLSHLIKQRTKA